MKITNKNSNDAKKTAKKTALPGELMMVAICFITAAIILFVSDLIMYLATKGRARIPIIVQSAVCVLFLAISLILGFAGIAQKNKLNRRRIIEEICANADMDNNEHENINADTNKTV